VDYNRKEIFKKYRNDRKAGFIFKINNNKNSESKTIALYVRVITLLCLPNSTPLFPDGQITQKRPQKMPMVGKKI
jgi:hypothetical protein